jgi:hypothetical protein
VGKMVRFVVASFEMEETLTTVSLAVRILMGGVPGWVWDTVTSVSDFVWLYWNPVPVISVDRSLFLGSPV